MSPEYDALRQIPSKHVPTLKAEIGATLMAARVKKGLAVEAVARQTRISRRYLEALEADRFDEFPALVYLRGFLKSYCEFLETDFEPLWAQVEAAAAPAPAPAAEEPAPPAPKRPAPHAPAAHVPAPRAPAAAGGGAAGAIVFSLLLAGGLGYWLLARRPAPAPAPVPEPPKALQPLPPAVEPAVLIRLKDDAWLSVTLDGQPVFEGRAPRGSTQEWKPVKALGLRTTSPEALAVEVNGAARELGPAGPDGEYRVDVQ